MHERLCLHLWKNDVTEPTPFLSRQSFAPRTHIRVTCLGTLTRVSCPSTLSYLDAEYKRRAVPKTFRTVCGTAATHTTCAAPIAHTNLVYPGAAGVSPVFPCSVFTKGACRKRPPRPAR